MNIVERKFILYIQNNQATAGQANGKSPNINTGKDRVCFQIAKGDEYVVPNHLVTGVLDFIHRTSQRTIHSLMFVWG
jgi:hypothetical protein